MNRKTEVALAIPMGVPHLGRVVHGIREYAKMRTQWRFLISPETHDLPPRSLVGWRGCGVIALSNSEEDEQVLSSLNCPVVNISGALERSSFPRVRNDYRAIGESGAAYLWERGFRRYGFYGVEGLWYSREIESGFRGYLEKKRVSIKRLQGASSIEGKALWEEGQEQLDAWLLSQKPPFAVMAAHDPRGAMVIRSCERVGLKVPMDVAVLGVNEDSGTCETCRPALSSIERNGFEVGFRAAETLDAMIRGESVAKETILPHGNICDRESTQTLALEHPALESAVRFVEKRYRKPITVEQMAEASGKSRRWLEQAFREHLDCSPSEFLERYRVGVVVKRLEDGIGLSVGMFANEAGFSGPRQLNAAFRRSFGKSLKEYMSC
ncbi:AraC family transcriptional regulator [Pelagicoccus mobilis]|uniref:XylR family transcriptional regulator n=1 Tax=Pelagicoccus mobilis TaxID=415221 RepID=A0A934RY35_9BACT|nr:XylR family transcriptional regulator [Pelagicoccus mobilis]MBK1879850.1 XylR family transcriptional regulator [Pelagicoccus mobilis]